MRRTTRHLIRIWMILWALGLGAAGFGGSAEAAEAPAFDVEAATEAYLAQVPADKRARSDAYFEGGYWLQLWNYLLALGVAWLLLGTRLSARLRDTVERWTRFQFLRTVLYGMAYILLTSLLTFPMAVYEGFFREHHYGLSTQSFGAWMGDQAKGLLLGLIFGSLTLAALYAVFRRAPRTWWLWGAALMLALAVFGLLVAPVFIAPLFNTYTELKDPALRGSILSLARASGVPADHVYVFDASRQTTRVSANVSGIGDTMRISLNDNLLTRTSPAGVRAVMGHEIGHYALNHVYESIVFFGVVIVAGFAFVRWSFERLVARRGERWGVRGIADLAGLPLLLVLLSTYFFLLTPLLNTYIRVNEAEADIYGLNAAREPDGFAETALILGEYRKLAPGPFEEWFFFDHPSGRSRIRMAMQWKAEQGAQAP